jgi:hypothetical protein
MGGELVGGERTNVGRDETRWSEDVRLARGREAAAMLRATATTTKSRRDRFDTIFVILV